MQGMQSLHGRRACSCYEDENIDGKGWMVKMESKDWIAAARQGLEDLAARGKDIE